MGDIGALYASGRQRITELVAELEDGEAKTSVPACPDWTVADVVGHLAGVCTDILHGNIEGVTTPPWTAAQVEARRDRPLADVLAEWSEAAPQVEAIAEHFPGRTGEQWAFDLACHEHDIRGALARPGARDSESVRRAVAFVCGGFAISVAQSGAPPLEVRTDDGQSWVVGAVPFEGTPDEALRAVAFGDVDFTGGEAGATLTANAFDLFRAMTGRRSVEQIKAFTWSEDPTPWLPAFTFGPFSPNPTPIDE